MTCVLNQNKILPLGLVMDKVGAVVELEGLGDEIVGRVEMLG